MRQWLNIDQSPDVLKAVYDSDYYNYLDSPEFHRAFLEPLGTILNEIGGSVLDVGCGEGQLSDHVTLPYLGIDGSATAIERALEKRGTSQKLFSQERIEDFCHAYCGPYSVAVFGGLLSVLIRPECRSSFVSKYVWSAGLRYFAVYDLETLDTSEIDSQFKLIRELHATADVANLQDVPIKRHRKVLVYSC